MDLNMDNPIVFETEFYTIHHATSFFIPGYLVICPNKKKIAWREFTKESLTHLGPLIALSHTCVDEVIRPERIYSNQYGEYEKNIHFHIFPRSQEATEKYLADQNLEYGHSISGPAFVDWVFNHRHLFTATPREVDDVVHKITCEYKKRTASN